jgi:anthranilate synthase component I
MVTPDKQHFLEKAERGNLIPVWKEFFSDQETPVLAYERLRDALQKKGARDGMFLLESVEGGERIARYSFLGGQPRALFRSFGRRVEIEETGGTTRTFNDVEPLAALREYMSRYNPVPDPGLPMFFGGAVGYIGYDAVAQFEKAPISPHEGLGWPDMIMAITETLIIFDHVNHSMKVVANAFIEGDPEQAYARALERINETCAWLAVPVQTMMLDTQTQPEPLPYTSNVTMDYFRDAVERAKEYIRAGDIIQVVLSQRFEATSVGDALSVYRALRSINPSPYMFSLEYGDRCVVGSSPEIHVRCERGRVEVRPIAGTRPRGETPEKDVALEKELLADPKERAEHIMLVDLGRNDIGRVCTYGTVKTPELMVIERYSHVMHIVSDVVGRLEEGRDAYDVMRATFPAGTVSGAPKIRAMEIIAELETTKRGAYAGAVGYFSFGGDLDSCITIRTVLMDGDKAYVQAGAGIVADSDPQKEFEETQNKARGMLKALALARHIHQTSKGNAS